MKQSDNYLDYVFQRAPDLDWEIEVPNDEDAIADGSMEHAEANRPLVVLHIRRRGLSHYIAHRFFDRPAYSHVHLEPFGSFIWQQIDGKRSVYGIGQLLHEAFGEEAEPLYERLSVYMKQLERNGLIRRVRQETCDAPERG